LVSLTETKCKLLAILAQTDVILTSYINILSFRAVLMNCTIVGVVIPGIWAYFVKWVFWQ